MSYEHHTIAIHFAKALLDNATEHGLARGDLMLAAGLNQPMLDTPRLRIPPSQFSQLLQAIWRQGDDEFLGITALPCRYGLFALLAKHTVHCRNLHGVYHQICNFYRLTQAGIQLQLQVRGAQAQLKLHLTDSDKDQHLLLRELLLIMLHRYPSWLVGQRIPLEGIELEYRAPAHVAEYRLMFPGPTHFEQATNSLRFPTHCLSFPVVQTAQSLSTYLRRIPLDWFSQQAYYPVFTRRVLDLLEQNTQWLASMQTIATLLHVTPRTLHRKLAQEGTSFQILKDQLRRDYAIHYLSQSGLALSVIAHQLGFSETAAFSRAFRQWTGLPPSVYREHTTIAAS